MTAPLRPQGPRSVSTQSKVPSFFNHCYAVLKPATYEALVDALGPAKANDKDIPNRILREIFSGSEVRHTKSGDREWTGLYLYGKKAYLEVFAVGAMPGFERGVSGVATSSEQKGSAENVAASLSEVYGKDKVEIFEVTRKNAEGVEVPWFRSAEAVDSFTEVACWHMEYEPRADPLTREQYHEKNYAPNKLVNDWTTVHAAFSPKTIGEFVTYAKAMGFKTEFQGDVTVIHDAEGRTLRMEQEAGDRKGIYRLEASLNANVPVRMTKKIGEAHLSIEGRTAVLDYDGKF